MDARPHTARPAYRLGYTSAAFGFLSATARVVGRRAAGWIATTFAGFYCRTNPDLVALLDANRELLTGEKTPPGAGADNFRNFALTLADYLWLASQPPGVGFRLADLGPGIESLREASADGSGAILATGHYGFFEFGALVLGQMGFPVSVVTFAEPSSELTRWRADYRRRWGAETIEIGNDAFSSLRANEAIDRGRLTAMLIDRPLGGRSLEVELPGGRIPFSLSPALLSWMTGCAIVPVSVRRTPSGRYAIQAGAAVRCDRSLPREESLARCTREVAAALVADFRHDPSQWYQFVPLTPP